MSEINVLNQQEIDAVSGGISLSGVVVTFVVSTIYGLSWSCCINKLQKTKSNESCCLTTMIITGLSWLTGLYVYIAYDSLSGSPEVKEEEQHTFSGNSTLTAS
jgi:hypothetical protein